MKIRTHRLTEMDYEEKVCEFCGKQGRYWTQAEGVNGKAHSRCVWHCQNHRNEAKELVETIAK